jgi:release factor glutamine methyltransferase
MPELALSSAVLVTEGTDSLRNAGVADARRQALRIWAELQGVSLGESLLTGGVVVDPQRAALYREAIRRRAAGEPLPHVTGKVGFRHLTLQIDGRALIPRPETEGLVELLLHRVRRGSVADVGTGSGCIALSLAQEGEFGSILALDASAEALALAQLNHQLVGAPRTVHFVRGDLATALAPGSLDAMISNPPYLTLNEYARLDPSVRDWEPAMALTAGADGMEQTTRLVRQGWAWVRPGGWMALELDCSRANAAATLAAGNGWQNVSLHRDLFGRERYLLAQRSDTR